jgi:hypothetical protein
VFAPKRSRETRSTPEGDLRGQVALLGGDPGALEDPRLFEDPLRGGDPGAPEDPLLFGDPVRGKDPGAFEGVGAGAAAGAVEGEDASA